MLTICFTREDEMRTKDNLFTSNTDRLRSWGNFWSSRLILLKTSPGLALSIFTYLVTGWVSHIWLLIIWFGSMAKMLVFPYNLFCFLKFCFFGDDFSLVFFHLTTILMVMSMAVVIRVLIMMVSVTKMQQRGKITGKRYPSPLHTTAKIVTAGWN